jgi:RNA polymerase sigma-70 factor (ECF subfamily)
VFVLREVFALSYDEIADALDKTPAAVRQVASRARAHVEERRPRADVPAGLREQVVQRFLAATATGDIQGLLDVLSPDVVLVSDGGGVKKAALRPILGREKVIRFLDAVAPKDGTAHADVVVVNGAPALRVFVAGELDAVGSLLFEDGVVTAIYYVRNPAKLTRLDEVVRLTR